VRSEQGAAERTTRFVGLTHPELLALTLRPTPQLVEGLIEAGTPGTIAGLPETYKSWLALQIALRVASGGAVLDREIVVSGSVGYWWQDDSRENEVRRIQSYARQHGYTDELPIRWHLNDALTLPDGITDLRAEVEREQQVLVVLDSLYNFLPGLKLKDEDVAQVIAALKAEVCDPTGCALLFVDHSPWPTESNHGQRRGYGSVFKAAAIRWGIYLDKSGETIFVEGRGNNVVGLPRTAALWDAERLELRLVRAPSETDDLADRIADFLSRNPGSTTSVIRAAVRGNDTHIKQRLEHDERFANVPPAIFGKPRNAICWVLAADVPSLLDATSAEDGADVGQTLPPVTDDDVCPTPLTPEGGGVEADVGSQPLPDDEQTSESEGA
jgi:AAA domain